VIPSEFAGTRLRELGAPLDWDRVRVLPPPVWPVQALPPAAGASEPYALVVSRLSPEKGVDVAIDACRIAGIGLVIAGDGPELGALRERAGEAQVRFAGRVADAELAVLRAGAAIALAPSRSAETFGAAIAEAMAAGLPVAASRVGALPELVEQDGLVAPGDARALADAIKRRAGDAAAGERGAARVRALCSPAAVAEALARIYDPGPRAASA
jgi:glycosyltransferase involved in cell wall biosynthesis